MIETISSWIAVLSYSVVPALGEGLWRGLLLAISAAIMLSLLRFNASSRHALWLLILIAICAIPVFFSGSKGLPASGKEFLPINRVAAIEESGSSFQIPVRVAAGILGSILAISLFRVALLIHACMALSVLRKKSMIAPAWLQELLKECASHARIKRIIQIRLSSGIESPALAGFFQPVVLFPAHVLIRLDPQEIQQVLLHEIAHLKRHDDWAILIQRFLSAIFFFNPAVVWICRQMDLEREIACDDSVIEAGGTPRSYALCLTRLAEISLVSRPLAGSTLLSASNQLSRRVDMLLNRSKKSSGMSTLSAICGILLLSGLALWLSHASPLLAVTEREQKPQIIVQAQQTELPPTNSLAVNGFKSASKRMQQAQRKMEEAREEMLEAADAMRQAKEMAGCQKTMDCEEMHEMQNMHDASEHKEIQSEVEVHGERIHREHERVMRQVEREVLRNEKRKVIRIVPELSDLPSREPHLPRVPREPLEVLPQLAAPSVPRPAMQPKVATPEQPPTPPTPEIAPAPNFESYPMPEYAPELPDEPEPPEQEF